MRALGVYREAAFSPGKVGEDAAILDAVLAQLRECGFQLSVIDADRFAGQEPVRDADLVLAMCQGERALARLAGLERRGAVAVNSALAIRNCYRDLLGAGLLKADVPVPAGALVKTATPPGDAMAFDGLNPDAPVYVKRGDLHALGPGDVQRVEGRGMLMAALADLARRGVTLAYLQQAVEGRLVKFYGVSGGEYFCALPEDNGAISDRAQFGLARKASAAAGALGLEVWGGDAIIDGQRPVIIDFNDWPSYSRVRKDAARAIARRCLAVMEQRRRADV